MFPGIKVTIGDREWTVPAISLGQLRNGVQAKFRRHDELVAKREGGDAEAYWEQMTLRGEIIMEALGRNYSAEELAGLDLDLADVQRLWLPVLGLSGFDEATAGDARPLTSGASTTG